MLPFHRLTFLGFALFAGTCLFTAWSLSVQEETSGWVDHTNLVIQQSTQLLSLSVDAEDGERSFLATGAERYYQDYERARDGLAGQFDKLRRLTRDNARQQQRLGRLDGVITTRLSQLAETIHVYRDEGEDAARKLVLTGRATETMDEIRSLLSEFDAEERVLLAQRVQRRHKILVTGAVGAGFSSFLALLLLLRANWKRRKHAADIWTARQNEQQLRLLQLLVEQAPMGILMLDRNLHQIQVSQRWLDDFGLTREKVVGKHHYQTFPNLPPHWIDAHQRGLAGEALAGDEDRYVSPDGAEHWVNWRIAPWGDRGENTGGIVIYSDDITRRKQAEESARQHELQYRALFENMPEAAAYCQIILDPQGDPADFLLMTVNSAFSTLTGRYDVAGKTMSQAFTTLDSDTLKLYGRVSLTGISEKVEYFSRNIHKWLDLSVYSPERGFFVVIFEDITHRKEQEFSARQWQRAFEESQSGIVLAEADSGKITAVNSAYARSLGYRIDELVGRDIRTLYSDQELVHRNAVLQAADPHGDHVLFESVQMSKTGEPVPVLIDITNIRDAAGTAVSRVKIIHNLTELKRTNKALRTSEARAFSLFENARQGILTADREGRIVDANATVHRLFGYTWPELISTPVRRVLPANLNVGDTLQPVEVAGLRKDGSEFRVEISLNYVPELQDGLTMAFISDITERLRGSDALRDSEAQFRTLANAIPNLCWMAHADGRVFWYNQRWYEYTGTTKEEMEVWGWDAFHDRDVLPEVKERWAASVASGDEFEMVFPLRGADSLFRPFLSRVKPVRNAAGTVTLWFGTNTDISGQRNTEEVLRSRTQALEAANGDLKRTSDALRITEARARSLFDNASQGILTADSQGHIVDANAVVQGLFGYTALELIGANVEMLIPEHMRDSHTDLPEMNLSQPHAGLLGQGKNLVALRKDRSEFPVEISLSFVGEPGEGVSMAFVSDITARKKAEQEREGLIARLEAALGEKTVLLQEVHHRVKNNLAIIGALLGMQASMLEDGRARTALGESQQRVMSMARIHEFLYGTEKLDSVNFGKYVRQLTSELCETYALDASKVRVRITAETIDLPVHQAIPCGLILNELLTNVLKYAFPEGRGGEVNVRFIRLDSGQLSLSCCDDGVGMPADFEWQSAKSLGLRIIRILAAQIEGELVLGRDCPGTMFELKFPPASISYFRP